MRKFIFGFNIYEVILTYMLKFKKNGVYESFQNLSQTSITCFCAVQWNGYNKVLFTNLSKLLINLCVFLVYFSLLSFFFGIFILFSFSFCIAIIDFICNSKGLHYFKLSIILLFLLYLLLCNILFCL